MFQVGLKEPPHVHFSKSKSWEDAGKIWLNNLKIAKKGNFTAKELNVIQKLANKYQKQLMNMYSKFGKEKIKPIHLTLK
ncbi:MAG: DUF4160 domain-containing protein [Bacteroidota bacterium]